MSAGSWTPNSKVTDGALAGGVATIVVWALGEYAGLMLPAPVAAAAVLVVAKSVAYLLPERRS